jgi:hypothetical protein
MATVNEVEGKSLYFSTTDTLQTMFTNCLKVEGFRDSSSVTLFRARSPSLEPSHPPQGQSPSSRPGHPPQNPVALFRAQSPSSGPSNPPQDPVTLLRAQSPSTEPSHPPQGPVTLFRAQSPSSEPNHHHQSQVTIFKAQLPSIWPLSTSEPSHPPQSSVIHSENGRLGALQCSIPASFACLLGAHVSHFLRCMPALINVPDDKITTVPYNKKDERYKNIILTRVLYK